MGNIQAATTDDLKCSSENWVFVDPGFASKKPTCGLLVGDRKPDTLNFAGLKIALADICNNGTTPLNLVLEAPLSVAFDSNGNPVGRCFEKRGKEHRYWYCGVGCSVLIAATYLLRSLLDQKLSREVRLFEGFVSFKKKGAPSSHERDVLALRDVVLKLDKAPAGIVYREEMQANSNGALCSAFKVAGMDFGVPPVVVVKELP